LTGVRVRAWSPFTLLFTLPFGLFLAFIKARNNACKVKISYRPTTLSFLSVSSKKSRYPCFYKMASDVN